MQRVISEYKEKDVALTLNPKLPVMQSSAHPSHLMKRLLNSFTFYPFVFV